MSSAGGSSARSSGCSSRDPGSPGAGRYAAGVRVIAGSARGTRLGPVPTGVRPVSDRAREGVFASLGPTVVEAQCLDLYAGTGAMGLEALSRGAMSCVFVDRSRAAAVTIRDNLSRTHLTERGSVRTAEVGGFLRKGTAPEEGFDLVFLDPPYDTGAREIEERLGALASGWLAAEGWTVVLTRGHKGPLPAVPVHWAARRTLRYGDSLLTLYREDRWA
jgi:16S rRNA (guanine966-N2)-methyltransferase